jgi:ADP-ribose pyrophosphatase YjhB (NUDIX family)
MNEQCRFCKYCGQPLSFVERDDGQPLRLTCSACNKIEYDGPRALVLTLIFAEGRVLLMKRGLPPYAGTWAPPGGFVEMNESLEAAAVREVAEEIGVHLAPQLLIPRAIVSIPEMNQIYVTFLANLPRMVTPSPCEPEALDARWFTLEEYPRDLQWDPAIGVDVEEMFHHMSSGHFHFYQRTGSKLRVFGPKLRTDSSSS